MTSASFTWGRLDEAIDRDTALLDALEKRLPDTDEPAVEGPPKTAALGSVVSDYVSLAESQRLTSSQIAHNRFWQKHIHEHRAIYEESTALHDAVLELQKVHDELARGGENATADLVERERALRARIEERTGRLYPRSFVTVEQPEPSHWIVRVQMLTDIEDRAFVEAFLGAVESTWRFEDATQRFETVVDMLYVTPAELYEPDQPPEHGAQIDVGPHVDRFEAGVAVLTTGAAVTYFNAVRAIILGTQDVSPGSLAHEFGHVLGFDDGYFRGYRDLGPEGYEILEVVADPQDIMGNSGEGKVLRHHFERLVRR